MIHTNLKKKFSYCILAFLLFAVICVWKKGSYYEAIKFQAGEFQMSKSLEELALGSGSQSLSSSAKEDRKLDVRILSRLKVTAKDRQQFSSFPVWNKNSSYKNVEPRLQKIWKNYVSMNKYRVSYKGPGPGVKFSPKALRCHLRDHVNVSMIGATDFPFNVPEWVNYLPKEDFRTKAGPWHRCAVLSSAGSLKSSQLGQEIDNHDAVLRFNAAPTANFQQDVGSKTTIRLVNSQLVTTNRRFLEDRLYHEGILIVWDPSVYHANVSQWYQKPDYNFFEKYQQYRRQNPAQPVYILRPQMPWELWDIIQEISPDQIQPNPPSSGMLGIVIMMTLCDQVDVYEFLPSKRKTDVCYYYQKFFDSACTMGAYHPLLFEKNMVKHLNEGTDEDIYLLGKATLSGFRNIHC